MIETRLAAALADPDLPPVVDGGLKREELHRRGAVVLHEIAFDGLGCNRDAAVSTRVAPRAAPVPLARRGTVISRHCLTLASCPCAFVPDSHTQTHHPLQTRGSDP